MKSIAIVFVGMCLLFSGQQVLGQSNPFPDTDLRTLEGLSASDLYQKGIITGFPDGEFKGYQPVNRAQAAKILLTAAKIPVENITNNGKFLDVANDVWYTNFVMTAAKRGIIAGHSDRTFKPNDRINTAEFLKMLTLAFGATQNMPHGYLDVTNEWFSPYAGVAWQNDLFPKRTASGLLPATQLSRNNVVVAIFNYLQRHPDLWSKGAKQSRGSYTSVATSSTSAKASVPIVTGGRSSFSSSSAISSTSSSREVSSDAKGEPRIIPVTAELWKFTPATIVVQEGEDVMIELMGISGTHGFRVPDLNIDVEITPLEVKRFTLPTDKPGIYQIVCSVQCGSGHSTMTGWISIEAK